MKSSIKCPDAITDIQVRYSFFMVLVYPCNMDKKWINYEQIETC